MAKYLYDESTKSFTLLNEKLIVDEKDYKDIYLKNLDDIKNDIGGVSVSDNKIFYSKYKKYIRVDNTYNTWEVIQNDDFTPREGFSTFEVDAKDLYNATVSKLNGKIVLFIKDKFKEYEITRYEEFDYINKKIKPNLPLLRGEILGYDFNVDKIIDNCTKRGFRISISGNEYFQPFNHIEDNIFFLSLKETRPDDRQMKLYTNRDINDSSLNTFSVARGRIISDSLIERFLYLIRTYSFYLPEVARTFYETLLKCETKDQIENYRDTYLENIMDYIKNTYVDKEIGNYHVLNVLVPDEKVQGFDKDDNDNKEKSKEDNNIPKKDDNKDKEVKKEDKKEDKPSEIKKDDKKEEDHKDDNKYKEDKKKDDKPENKPIEEDHSNDNDKKDNKPYGK